MSAFAKLNNFERNEDGVYVADVSGNAFAYSDGVETEAKLYQILSNATDLSSESEELQQQIVDWPTEYHLSSTRANLLRPLNLSGVTRVLELGCGCGSITRYLGEHPHLTVDAIEGSQARAGLAALRCRDLENVSISVANFNDVEFPEDHYDLVLFVGVTEYAGRFSQRSTDQEALQDLLTLGRKASASDGCTLIAIENRLGLKYMLGANEDHYAKRFVGLDNYPESTGIRTYSRHEWVEQIQQNGYKNHLFAFPFPDYKVPTVMVSDKADKSAIVNALEHVHSRDYSEAFTLGESEHRAWQGLLDAGNFADHANSFLILLSDDANQLSRLSSFELATYERPKLSYLLGQPTTDVAANHAANGKAAAQRMQSEIKRLKAHAASLEARIDLILQSRSWRIINRLRRLFGRNKV